MKTKFIKILFFIQFILLSFSSLEAKVNNIIVAKVENEIITAYDLENEIKTILVLANKPLTQENINEVKNFAMKSLIRKLIKKSEVERYNVTKYNEKDLNGYILQISKGLGTNSSGLKKIFKENEINYDVLVEKFKIELLWNTLIYSLYKNQITINSVELENEIKSKLLNKEDKQYKLSEIEISAKDNSQDSFNKIYEAIKKEGFYQAVKKFSISSSNLDKGNIGWFNENSLSKVYFDQIKKLKKGEVSKPIRTMESFVILKVEDIKLQDNSNLDVDKLKDSILSRKKEEKLNLFSRSHFSKLENSAFIKLQ
tara:strand:- start:233 stop:1168 length:936 start_codon:yes stop_codon:yes gene_type:complete